MIRLVNVTKTFGSGVVALDDVTLELTSGELVLITGPSGAGKTTLLKTIYGAERPESGQIHVAEREVSALAPRALPALRRELGVVFQDFKLLPDRSALENVALALEVRGVARRETRARSVEALGQVGLERSERALVRDLSGGEQQRVAVARALVAEPQVILADEPTGNLDPERSHDILDLLDAHARRGALVLLATHDPMVMQYAASTRVLRIEQGALVQVQAGTRAPIDLHPKAPEQAPPELGLRPAEALT